MRQSVELRKSCSDGDGGCCSGSGGGGVGSRPADFKRLSGGTTQVNAYDDERIEYASHVLNDRNGIGFINDETFHGRAL